jgi:hypothetical protein
VFQASSAILTFCAADSSLKGGKGGLASFACVILPPVILGFYLPGLT